MSDYRATWEELEARRLAAHLERTAARVLLLRDRYETAMGMVSGEITPEPRHPDEYVRRTEGAGRAPTNVPALDLVLEVEAFVSDWLPLLRGTVRAGSWRPAGGGQGGFGGPGASQAGGQGGFGGPGGGDWGAPAGGGSATAPLSEDPWATGGQSEEPPF